MNIKHIIITAGLGLICFAASFTVGLFTRTAEEPVVADGVPAGAEVIETLGSEDGLGADSGYDTVAASGGFQAKQVNFDRSLSVKQLRGLVFEMRSKLSEFAVKDKMLADKEARIQVSIEDLQKNVMEMEDLRVKLSATVSSIKQQQKYLDDKVLRIKETERKNIIKTASIYDKMKAAQASEIMVNLATSNQLDYAVKIAYYMTERTSANLIGEISKNKPELAATISNRMRWIEEVQ